MHSPSVVLVLLLLAAMAKSQENWNYSVNGYDWKGACQTGERQSPINIRILLTYPNREGAAPFRLINYNRQVAVSVIVDQEHFTIKLTPDPKVRIAISGGGLRDTYVLQSAHFHFGSEHLLDSKRLALESHLVHYREVYGSQKDAATNDPKGIAVIGTLFCQASKNFNLQKVIEGANDEVKLKFRDFLPENLDFYRYHGSLTTPPCSEAVIWIVFKNSLPVSKQQLVTIKNAFPEDVKSTFRKVQPLNGRQVERWNTFTTISFSLIRKRITILRM